MNVCSETLFLLPGRVLKRYTLEDLSSNRESIKKFDVFQSVFFAEPIFVTFCASVPPNSCPLFESFFINKIVQPLSKPPGPLDHIMCQTPLCLAMDKV